MSVSYFPFLYPLFIVDIDTGPKVKRARHYQNVSKEVIEDLNKLVDAFKIERVGEVVHVPKLSEFVGKYGGGMPSSYFIRLEALKVYQILTAAFMESGKFNFMAAKQIIKGSPGVGKTVLLIIFTLNAGLINSCHTYLLRKMHVEVTSVVPYYGIEFKDGGYCVCSLAQLNNAFINGFEGAVFLDGFRQNDLAEGTLYGPILRTRFRLLCTSAQYSLSEGDNLSQVLLPAWQYEDLELYDIIMKNGDIDTIKKEAKHKYSVSGGSFRLFCKESEEIQNAVSIALATPWPYDCRILLGNFGVTNIAQVDRLRRAFVKNRADTSNYNSFKYWVHMVDSKYAANQLLSRITLEEIRLSYDFGKSVGGKFYGNIFELYCHKLAQAGELKFRVFDYPYTETKGVDICLTKSDYTLGAKSYDECIVSLKGWLGSKSGYWEPGFDTLETIDAFAKHDGRVLDLQFTIMTNHKLNLPVLKRYHDAIDLSGSTLHLYIAIVPDAETCKKFKLDITEMRMETRNTAKPEFNCTLMVGHLCH